MIPQGIDNQFPTPLSLLARLRSGSDGTDWKNFVDLYSDLIRRWLARAGVPAGEVDDLLQDSLVDLVNGISQFDHNGRAGAFRNWLKTVVVHRAASWFRRSHRRRELASETLLPWTTAIEDRMQASGWQQEHDEYVLRNLMQRVRCDVSETTWTAFYRQAVKNAMPADVALELGISKNAAILAKSRVLRRLRDLAQGLVD
jgi:RNA polymerase sigma-70 factor, ECF subfamily